LAVAVTRIPVISGNLTEICTEFGMNTRMSAFAVLLYLSCVIPAAAATVQPADSRFSIMWLSGGVPHRAAIRGDASIRDTDDVGLTVTRTGVGQFCVHATSPSEGTVGVTQDAGSGLPGTINVTMGAGNPCPTVPSAQIFVQTFVIQ
jgi:hypothetical protein